MAAVIFCIDYCLRCLMFGHLCAHMRHVSCRLMAFLVHKGRARFFWRGRMFDLRWLGQTVWAMKAMWAMDIVAMIPRKPVYLSLLDDCESLHRKRASNTDGDFT